MEYAYGRSEQRVGQEDFGPDFLYAAIESGKLGGLLKQMIWILHFMRSLPDRLVVMLSPNFTCIIRMYKVS